MIIRLIKTSVTLLTLPVIVMLVSCSSNDEPTRVDCTTVNLNLSVTGTTNPNSCAVNNGSITVSATGGEAPYTFALNNSTSFQSSSTFSNLGSGIFIVTVKDRNGCTQSITNVVLSAPDAPEASVESTQADSECTSDTGILTVNAAGGTGVLSYSRNGTTFQASNIFANLRAGNYVITVKDESGCTTSVNAQVANQTGVSYDLNVKALFQNECSGNGCHPSQGDLFTYSSAKNLASAIKSRTQSGNMPPNGTLSQAEKDLIACWVDHGAPEN
jgi:hypothetical protein